MTGSTDCSWLYRQYRQRGSRTYLRHGGDVGHDVLKLRGATYADEQLLGLIVDSHEKGGLVRAALLPLRIRLEEVQGKACDTAAKAESASKPACESAFVSAMSQRTVSSTQPR